MTIKQIFKKHSSYTKLAEDDYDDVMDEEDFTNAAKELIEYHVKSALLQASENVCMKPMDVGFAVTTKIEFCIDKDSILNSYPLDLIK